MKTIFTKFIKHTRFFSTAVMMILLISLLTGLAGCSASHQSSGEVKLRCKGRKSEGRYIYVP